MTGRRRDGFDAHRCARQRKASVSTPRPENATLTIETQQRTETSILCSKFGKLVLYGTATVGAFSIAHPISHPLD
jgi:hypothetical protein